MKKKSYNYINAKPSKDGTFTPDISAETNKLLTIYCKYKNLNKTKYVNELVKKDMDEKFAKLFEE